LSKVGRSLPNLVRVPSHDFRDILRFLCLSDGDDQAPQALLTGGLLVRVQPEEPIPSRVYERDAETHSLTVPKSVPTP
jgi:hypothetical protein